MFLISAFENYYNKTITYPSSMNHQIFTSIFFLSIQNQNIIPFDNLKYEYSYGQVLSTQNFRICTSLPLPWCAASFLSYFFRISDALLLELPPLPISSISLPISLLCEPPPNFSASSSSNSKVRCNAWKNEQRNPEVSHEIPDFQKKINKKLWWHSMISRKVIVITKNSAVSHSMPNQNTAYQ